MPEGQERIDTHALVSILAELDNLAAEEIGLDERPAVMLQQQEFLLLRKIAQLESVLAGEVGKRGGAHDLSQLAPKTIFLRQEVAARTEQLARLKKMTARAHEAIRQQRTDNEVLRQGNSMLVQEIGEQDRKLLASAPEEHEERVLLAEIHRTRAETEKKRAALIKELMAEKEQLQGLIANSPEACLVLNEVESLRKWVHCIPGLKDQDGLAALFSHLDRADQLLEQEKELAGVKGDSWRLINAERQGLSEEMAWVAGERAACRLWGELICPRIVQLKRRVDELAEQQTVLNLSSANEEVHIWRDTVEWRKGEIVAQQLTERLFKQLSDQMNRRGLTGQAPQAPQHELVR